MPDPTAIAAWVAERKRLHRSEVDYDEDGRQISKPGCEECQELWPCEESQKLAVIEAAARGHHTDDAGWSHKVGFAQNPCALCAALHHLTQGEQDGD